MSNEEKKSLWENDNIQFARLIAEGEAAGIFTEEKVQEMCSSMDLEKDQFFEIVDRAQSAWDNHLSQLRGN